jgi:hypothetical protein
VRNWSNGTAEVPIYIDTDNWKDAEELWIADNHGRLLGGIVVESRRWALAAARAGARDEAIRLWRRSANSDRGDLNGLFLHQKLGRTLFASVLLYIALDRVFDKGIDYRRRRMEARRLRPRL